MERGNQMREVLMETDTREAKSSAWLAWLMAGVMTAISLNVGLVHANAGWVATGEALLMGPAVAGYLLGVLTAWATGTGSLAWFWLCGACTAMAGWYSLLVWLFVSGRPVSGRCKVFWIVVLLLTWGPAVVLAILISAGVPIGSSV